MAPVTLSPEGGTRPLVKMTPSGHAIAVWSDPSFNDVFVADMPPLGSFGAPRKLATAAATLPVTAIGANGDAVVAWGDATDNLLRVAVRPAGGEFGEPTALGDPGHGLLPSRSNAAAVAVGPGGTALISWLETKNDRDFYSNREHYIRVRAAWRPPGGQFGAPQDISHFYSGTSDLSATIDTSGRATIAWVAGAPDEKPSNWAGPQPGCGTADCSQARSHVWSAMGTAAGFGAPVDVSGHVGFVAFSTGNMALAGNGSGEVVAGWRQDEVAGRGGAWGATRNPDGVWGAPRSLNRGASFPARDFATAIDERGNAVVAWAGECELAFRYRPAGADFGPVQEGCTDSQSAEPAAGIDAAGRAVVAWGDNRGSGARSPMHTIRYTHGVGSEPIFDVSTRAGGRNIGASVAFDALGNGVVVWEGDSGDGARSGYDGNRPLSVAMYDATPPKLAAVDVDDGGGRPRFQYRLSEPAQVSVFVERRVPCKRSRKRCFARVGTLRGRGKAGANRLAVPARVRRAAARRGSYRARLIASDRAGNRGRERSVRFRALGR
jgi:hypothetical protein